MNELCKSVCILSTNEIDFWRVITRFLTCSHLIFCGCFVSLWIYMQLWLFAYIFNYWFITLIILIFYVFISLFHHEFTRLSLMLLNSFFSYIHGIIVTLHLHQCELYSMDILIPDYFVFQLINFNWCSRSIRQLWIRTFSESDIPDPNKEYQFTNKTIKLILRFSCHRCMIWSMLINPIYWNSFAHSWIEPSRAIWVQCNTSDRYIVTSYSTYNRE